ncbi:MAG: hypothetical protein U1D97_02440 [Desulfuromonadales bacterium]|nr:hypothetical protein [Desulfuromonadales bacterium]
MPAIKLAQIEDAVVNLAPDDYRRFYDWLVELDHKKWDRQIEEDAAAGRLDSLADEALRDLREGRCRKM